MAFNSIQYALFLAVVFLAYWRLPRSGQNLLLLAASWGFYALWEWRFLGFLVLSTTVDYVVGRLLGHDADPSRRKAIFALSLAVNLGILGTLKYFNFFAGSFVDLLQRFGVSAGNPTFEILLPIGISFYTFHGISYTFDVYRREISTCRNFVDFAVFVAFFPQLVAGPIGRAGLQLPQFGSDRERPDRRGMVGALHLILLGLFKKVVLADSIAPFVETAFSSRATASWVTLVAGAWAFAFQIYADFSGYSDIARGSARLLGIDLPENFNQPYLSRNITDFWRTWHISLSRWLRDYLYIPLGGNRRGSIITARNLLITMLLGGLWHGANWTFVVWGGMHGILLIVHRFGFKRRPDTANERLGVADILPVIATFNLVCVAWVFFRAETLGDAVTYLSGIFTARPGPVDAGWLFLVLCVGAATLTIDLAQRNHRSHTAILSWPPSAQGLAYGLILTALVVFGGNVSAPFIYFRF